MYKKLLFILTGFVLAATLSAQNYPPVLNYYANGIAIDHPPTDERAIDLTHSWHLGRVLNLSTYAYKYRQGSLVETEAYISINDPLANELKVDSEIDNSEHLEPVEKQLLEKVNELTRSNFRMSEENTQLKQENKILQDMLSDMLDRLENLEIANQKLSKDK